MKRTYIFDIDGTIADISHRLHLIKGKHLNGGPSKPDWDAFHDACVHDEPIWPVINTARHLSQSDALITMVTGRKEPWRQTTLNWLWDYRVPCHDLYMRPAHDNQPDYQLKRELYHTYIRDRMEVLAVFDDRTQVVEMWRGLGLQCFQVAPGDY